MERWPLVDELLVIDDHSSDRTAQVAADAGATILRADEILTGYGHGHGKGEALWKSLYASRGDLIVWCDADVRQFDPTFVVGLVGPLLTRPDVAFVKGFYERPVDGDQGRSGHRAGGPTGGVVAVPAVGPVRAAVGRRVRRPSRGPRAAALHRGLRGGPGAADRHRGPLRAGGHGPGRSRPADPPQPSAGPALAPGAGGPAGRPAPRRSGSGRAPPRCWSDRGAIRRWWT